MSTGGTPLLKPSHHYVGSPSGRHTRAGAVTLRGELATLRRVTYVQIANHECAGCGHWHPDRATCARCGCTEHEMPVETTSLAIYHVLLELGRRHWEKYGTSSKRHLWILHDRGKLIPVAIPPGRKIGGGADAAAGLANLRAKIEKRPNIPEILIGWAGAPAHRMSDPIVALAVPFVVGNPPVPNICGYDIHGNAYWIARVHVSPGAPPGPLSERVSVPILEQVTGTYGRRPYLPTTPDRVTGELARLLPLFAKTEVPPWMSSLDSTSPAGGSPPKPTPSRTAESASGTSSTFSPTSHPNAGTPVTTPGTPAIFEDSNADTTCGPSRSSGTEL